MLGSGDPSLPHGGITFLLPPVPLPSHQLAAPPSCPLPGEAQQQGKAGTWPEAPQGSSSLWSPQGTDPPVPAKHRRVLPQTSQQVWGLDPSLPKARPPAGTGLQHLGCVLQSPRDRFGGCRRRSGPWQLPGEFQLPTAGCTLHFCFPHHEGRQPKPVWSPALVQDHLHGTVPMPANLLARTDFLFSPQHPSLSALLWKGWQAAHLCRGTPELWPSELGGQQGSVGLRTVVPTATE